MKTISKHSGRERHFLGNRGFSLVELIIASVIVSVVFLAILSSFGYITKSLVQTRLRTQVMSFAKAELDDFAKSARVYGDTDSPFFGWEQMLVRSDEDSDGKLTSAADLASPGYRVEEYPKQFTADEPYAGNTRYKLRRTAIQVGATMDEGKEYESKLFRVTLADNQTPARFAPVVIEARVKKPDQEALDRRTSTDFGHISGRVVDAVTPTNAVAGVKVKLTGNGNTYFYTTGSDGIYAFSNILVSGTYDITLTKNGYWKEKSDSFSIGSGANQRADMPIQKVFTCRVEVHVTEYVGGANVPTANATIAAICGNTDFSTNGLASELCLRNVNGATGIATYEVPIPVKGVNVTTYIGRVKVTTIGAGVNTLVNYNPNALFNLTKDGLVHLDYALYPVYKAKLNIYTYDGDAPGNPMLGHCWVEVKDACTTLYPGDTTFVDDTPANIANGTATILRKTSHYGLLQDVMIQTNVTGDLNLVTRTTRTVTITVKKVGYQIRSFTHTIDVNNPTLVANIDMRQHTFTHYLSYPNGTMLEDLLDLNTGANILPGSILPFEYVIQYNGHCGVINILEDSPSMNSGDLAANSYQHFQETTVSNPSIGYTTAESPVNGFTSRSSTSNINRFNASTTEGTTHVGHRAYFSFLYNAEQLYGEESDPVAVLFDQTIPSRVNVRQGAIPVGTYTVDIEERNEYFNYLYDNQHPSQIYPNSTEYFSAVPSGTSPQNVVTYVWSITGSAHGTTSSANGPDISITAGDNSNLGLNITARVDMYVDNIFANYDEVTLAINYNPLSCSYTPADDDIILPPYTGTRTYTASASGGLPPYRAYWSLLDEVDNTNVNFGSTTLTPSSTDPSEAGQATYVAGASGKYRIVLTVRDSLNQTAVYQSSVILNEDQGVR